MQTRYRLTAVAMAFLLLASAFGWAAAQSTSPRLPSIDTGIGFTYQGSLELNGQPVNGVCDFQFSLWDAETGGAQTGTTQEILALAVTRGRFTASLNSAGLNGVGEMDSVIYGAARWLEIAVRCPAGSGSYTTLNPRQALAAAPYAISLRPGADIIGSVASTVLSVENLYTPPDNTGLSLGLSGWGATMGVFGYSNGEGGVGVNGIDINGTGVKGTGDPGVAGYGGLYGVYGYGPASISAGVFGESYIGTGVAGGSDTGTGGYFQSNAPCCDGAAVKVWNTSNGIGVWASTGANAAFFGRGAGSGVVGEASANGGIGVVGRLGPGVSSGLAGQFLGNVDVTGSILGPIAGMQIDHPLHPAEQFLSQAYVSAPEMTSQYSGNVITGPDGFAVVKLPEYVEALNSDFRYNLTVIGQFAQAIVASELEGGSFTIQTDRPNVKVSWLVIGVRQDPYAMGQPLQVEAAKTGDEVNRYLYPQGYGLGAESRLESLYSLSAQAVGSPAMELVSPPPSAAPDLPAPSNPSGEVQ